MGLVSSDAVRRALFRRERAMDPKTNKREKKHRIV